MTEPERVLALIERHGWNATAFQTLEPGYHYFFAGDDACVAYLDTGSAWVAAGEPIAPRDQVASVAAAFLDAARAAGRRGCFFASEEPLGLATIRIGEQPAWDPAAWPATLARTRSLREQLRRARAKGVAIRELSPAELDAGPVRDAMARLGERWLATRQMAPMAFLVQLELFGHPLHRRCFVAEVAGRLVGFANVIPVPARDGWFIEDLLRDPDAPNGTGELLVDAVMRWAAERGSPWVTLGLAPLAGEVSGPLKLARALSALLYNFDGVRVFKAKLRPSTWAPVFLAHPAEQSAAISIVDSLAAFTRGGFVRFGLRTLLRGPTSALAVLALLLVPWMLLLALAPASPWFPAPWVKWAWVGFDGRVAVGLFRLVTSYARPLATALAIATVVDAVLTLLSALAWNLPQATSLFDVLALGVACAAPVLATVVLWGARRTRAR